MKYSRARPDSRRLAWPWQGGRVACYYSIYAGRPSPLPVARGGGSRKIYYYTRESTGTIWPLGGRQVERGGQIGFNHLPSQTDALQRTHVVRLLCVDWCFYSKSLVWIQLAVPAWAGDWETVGLDPSASGVDLLLLQPPDQWLVCITEFTGVFSMILYNVKYIYIYIYMYIYIFIYIYRNVTLNVLETWKY